jgi:hypothetical protein
MKLAGLVFLLASLTMAMAGCAQYDNAAMSSHAVDIPDEAKWPD